jgi:cation diffusion facilitator CzcD-associated flavoprotein CzcO
MVTILFWRKGDLAISQDVATKYDLDKYIKFNTKVESAKWDEENGVWRLDLTALDDTHFEDICEILVNGSGVLK